jgi:hypothetical protein
MTRTSEFSYSPAQWIAAPLGERGRVLGRVAPEALLLLGFPAHVAERLRLVRPLLHEPDGGQDEQGELEELGLPVLEHGPAEARREHVVAPRNGLPVVEQLVRVEGVLTCEGLRHEGREEDHPEEEREAVLEEEAPQSTTSATPIQRASPATIASE